MSTYASTSTMARWMAPVLLPLMALTVVLGSHAPASAASAGPADDADPGASAVLAPRDPGRGGIRTTDSRYATVCSM